jgi:LysM repeat protein
MPTFSITFTPTGDQRYVIQEGDSLQSIAQKFNLGDQGTLLIYYKNQADMEANNGVIFVGQSITIPPAGSVPPTTTPIPANLPRGTKVEYRVLPGDTLVGIAAKFNSIAEFIMEENNLTDANGLMVGQVLQIPVNLVTPTATLPASSTPRPTLTQTPSRTPIPTSTQTPSLTPF